MMRKLFQWINRLEQTPGGGWGLWFMLTGLFLLRPEENPSWLAQAFLVGGAVMFVASQAKHFVAAFKARLGHLIEADRSQQWTEEELKWAKKDKPDVVE